MASLYDIDRQLRILEDYMVDEETGEILSEEEFYKKFDEIQMALSDKIENTMCFYKNLMSDVEAFKAEEEKLKKRRIVKENLAERLKNRIDNYITFQYTDENGNVDTESLNKWKMETPKVKLSYRKSDSVEVIDSNAIPKDYLKIEEKVSLDKVKAKKDLKDGKEISGVALKINMNMLVK